jgi:metal-responsive CopG/Arc/MetJ family transcriptional regulator
MVTKKRSDNQTATAISLSKELFTAMEEARGDLQMDRSNFIRYCIAKELKRLGVKVSK